MRLILSVTLVLIATVAATLPSAAQSETYTIRLPFEQEVALDVGTTVSGVQVTDLMIRRDDKTPFDQVSLGESRYSWFEYGLRVQPTQGARNLRVHYRLYDANGAIIDEFEVEKRVWREKVRIVEGRRITLNYIVPLVKEVEVTVTAE